MLKKYGLFGSFVMAINLVRTKFLFPKARLIRFPIDIRGKKNMMVEEGFTSGTGCRFEVLPSQPTDKKLLVINKNVQVNDYVHITAVEGVTIGNNVLIASKVYISDVSHGQYKSASYSEGSPNVPPAKRPLIADPVVIEDNVWLGDGVCVLPGVTIGRGSIVGANAVVNKSLPAGCIAVGIPAKVVKKYNFDTERWEKVND